MRKVTALQILSNIRRRATKKAKRLQDRIQGKQLVHLLHIGKTGGTAVKYAIRECKQADAHYGIYLHSHKTKLKDVPEGEMVVFFLRDPISRFVSAFYSRQRQGQPRFSARWTPAEMIAFEHFSTPNQLAGALSSPNTEEREQATMAMRNIHHIKDTYWRWFESREYFIRRLPDIFFIGFQERLCEDFEFLKSKLHLPHGLILPADDILAHRNPEDLPKSLDNLAISNLQKWYEEDFQFINLCNRILRENPSIRGSG